MIDSPPIHHENDNKRLSFRHEKDFSPFKKAMKAHEGAPSSANHCHSGCYNRMKAKQKIHQQETHPIPAVAPTRSLSLFTLKVIVKLLRAFVFSKYLNLNFRANEGRTELVQVMLSAAENHKRSL